MSIHFRVNQYIYGEDGTGGERTDAHSIYIRAESRVGSFPKLPKILEVTQLEILRETILKKVLEIATAGNLVDIETE